MLLKNLKVKGAYLKKQSKFFIIGFRSKPQLSEAELEKFKAKDTFLAAEGIDENEKSRSVSSSRERNEKESRKNKEIRKKKNKDQKKKHKSKHHKEHKHHKKSKK